MRGNSHVRFLGEEVTARSSPYPTSRSRAQDESEMPAIFADVSNPRFSGSVSRIWRTSGFSMTPP